MTYANKVIYNILGAIWQASGSKSWLIQKSGFKSRITFCWGRRLGGGLCCLSSVYLYSLCISYVFIVLYTSLFAKRQQQQIKAKTKQTQLTGEQRV